MIRRRKTGNAIFLAILLACSAGAIGFSSWSYGEGVFGTSTDILTEVGNGYYTHDYITINQKNVGFKYSNSGFVDSTGKIGNVGNTIFSFKLLYSGINSLNETQKSNLSFNFKFYYSSISSASNISISALSLEYTNSSGMLKSINKTYVANSQILSFNFVYSDMESTMLSNNMDMNLSIYTSYLYSGSNFSTEVLPNLQSGFAILYSCEVKGL